MLTGNRSFTILRLALTLILSVLLLNSCRQEPADEWIVEPTLEAPSEALEEVAPPVVEREPTPTRTPRSGAEPVVAPLIPADNAESPELEEPAENGEASEEVPVDEAAPDVAPADEATDEEATTEDTSTGDVPDEVASEDGAEEAEASVRPAVTSTPAPVTRMQMPGAIATRTREEVISREALVIRPNVNVAPPLSIAVSANRQLDGHRFRVSGLLRNDSNEPYARLGVIATFYRNDGSRYGPIHARIQCPILGPGSVCPFIVEATDKDLAEVMLHPEGRPTDRRQPIPVDVVVTRRYVDNLGYVRIVGNVRNPNPVPAQDITINGVLLDNGQIVSMGAALVLGPLDPGTSAPFDIMVRYVPYNATEVYVQALPPR